MKLLLLATVAICVLLMGGCALGTATTTVPATTSTTSAPTTTTASPTTTTSTTEGPESVFRAELTGAEVVPPVDTTASGSAVFVIDADGKRAYFKLIANDIADVIASRVHEGKPGFSGQGLLILYPGPTLAGPFTGVLAQGYFDAAVLIGELTGETLADFAAMLQSGRAYVNVGTAQYPAGEIRGQIYWDAGDTQARKGNPE
ncbi:MAG: CHRD domain-containing protein [Thermoleophilia bacterium]|nr:CHRD domain-containing protein [Thermoleophilia bacterium]